ncbi:glycosyltransferase family 4 protein [Roseovarius sp. SYSU LYC5161]|uniref:glycosyltransferase family 4 protein n=1 Tax=Roseovarius halophilus (ex Wu et al. 2025) TaxID=3376060 RepID=UPI00399AF492
MAAPIPVIDAKREPSRVLVDQFLALEASEASCRGEDPGLIITLPPSWGNKYQILLYGAAARHGYAVAGVVHPENLSLVSWAGPVILHAHWFAGIFNDARSEGEARSRLHRACDQILAFRERTGARLIWTAHNVFPHGNRFPETFLELRRWTLEHFDAIHVLQESHVPVLEESYGKTLPNPFTVPHMTYCGTILDSVDPVAARAWLGLPSEARVFGFFGSLQSYKRLDRFLEAFDRLRRDSDRPVAAVIGGVPGADDTACRLQLDRDLDPDIRLLPRRIQDHEIQYLHRASDVMVFPYAETLNSGAALMSASFRTPFLMPRGLASAPLERLGGILFDPEDPDGLYRAMRSVVAGTSAPVFDETALEALKPARISGMFFEKLQETLNPPREEN